MDVQGIRRELRSFGSISSDIKGLKEHFVKPLRARSKDHKSHKFYSGLGMHEQKYLNKQLADFHKVLGALAIADQNTSKLSVISNAVVDMKLMHVQGRENSSKMAHLSNKLLNDEFHGMSAAITNIKHFDRKLNTVYEKYEQINGFLHQKLSLEHSVALMQMPHKQYLDNFQLKSHKQKKIVKHLGRHFLDIQKMLKARRKKD